MDESPINAQNQVNWPAGMPPADPFRVPPPSRHKTMLKRAAIALAILLLLAGLFLLRMPPNQLYELGVISYDHGHYQTALNFFEKACRRGEMRGCSAVGRIFEDGNAGARNLEQARLYYQQACEGDDARGCLGLGNLYDWGRGVPVDDAQAARDYQKACELGELDGCMQAGAVHQMGIYGQMPDDVTARGFYQLACDGAVIRGCYAVGSTFEHGDNADFAQARLAYDKACQSSDSDSCIALGRLYESGKGGEQDFVQARALYQRICDSDDLNAYGASCSALAQLVRQGLGGDADDVQARAGFQKACEADNPHRQSCLELATMLELGQGGPADPAQAKIFLLKAKGGDENNPAVDEVKIDSQTQPLIPAAPRRPAAQATHSRPAPIAEPATVEDASLRLRRECEAGSMTSCEELAGIYASGQGVTRNATKARALYLQACRSGRSSACAKMNALN